MKDFFSVIWKSIVATLTVMLTIFVVNVLIYIIIVLFALDADLHNWLLSLIS